MKSKVLNLMQFPLLTIELKQMAAERRTYIVRFIYAATLFGVACWLFFQSSAGGSPVIGRGEDLFRDLVWIQFGGLCLVIPAITCGVIAEDKGRNTLGILLLTPLGTVSSILQNLFSRRVPMFSFVLLSLPLLAVAYSYGGVSNAQLVQGIILLLMTAVQIGALSIWMSVLCQTTVSALMCTYAIFLLTFFSCAWAWPVWFLDFNYLDAKPFVPWFLCSGTCILGAALSIGSRVFQNSQNYVLQAQHEVDRFVQDANRLVGEIELLKEKNHKPQFNPVRWRETGRRSLGRIRYLLRILFIVELPLIFIASLVATNVGLAHTMLRALLWLGSLLLVGTYGAGLIAGERQRGSLDILLTTPLTGRSILLEKSSGLWRIILVAGVPIITLAIIEYVRAPSLVTGFTPLVMDFVWSVVSVLIWLPAVAWFALWISTRIRSQTVATYTVLSVVGAILLVPTLIAAVLGTGGVSDNTLRLLGLVSPTQIQATLSPFARDYYNLPTIPTWVLLTHFVIVATLVLVFRMLSLRNIDETLGRIPEDYEIDESQAPEEARLSK
ncbi:MAG: ABC transporter permease subunit [Planctomycetaceae bacterium]